MDEVETMTRAGAHAGETVGRAVGTGLQALRRGAEQVAAAAEHKLSDGLDMAADRRAELADTGRRARRQLARDAKLTGKELAKSAKQAKKTARTAMAVPGDMLAAAATPKQSRKKWPWLLGLVGIAAAGAGTAYVLKSRQASPPAQLTEEESAATPEPRREQQNSQPTHARHGG